MKEIQPLFIQINTFRGFLLTSPLYIMVTPEKKLNKKSQNWHRNQPIWAKNRSSDRNRLIKSGRTSRRFYPNIGPIQAKRADVSAESSARCPDFCRPKEEKRLFLTGMKMAEVLKYEVIH